MDVREGDTVRSTCEGRGSFTPELMCLWLGGIKEVTLVLGIVWSDGGVCVRVWVWQRNPDGGLSTSRDASWERTGFETQPFPL